MPAHPQAENMRLYAEDAAETDTPWERWQFRWKTRTNDCEWKPFSLHPSWRDDAEFRRKPKPVEYWAIVHNDKAVSVHYSEESAKSMLGLYKGSRVAHMREVTE